jgi:cell division protein FtsB
MQNDTHNGIVGFVIKYKISLIFILILISLVKQNILVNDFPNVIFQKQKTIEDVELSIKQLQNDNKQIQEQIDGYTEQDLSLIESQARFKYGLIKDGEIFYQINTTVETENAAESSESTL